MRTGKKSWTEKLHTANGLPQTKQLNAVMARKWGATTMYIPSPKEVDEIMKTVRKGKLITINEIRMMLAEKHHTDIACPLTTGIFSWIAAHASNEQMLNGAKRVTPYWRTLKSGGILNPKYPGGEQEQKKLLEAEGYNIVKKGKHWKVEDYEKHLMK